MSDVKPWEEQPDDGYWRALLGEPTAAPTAPRDGDENKSAIPPTSSGWALAEKSYAQGDTLELRVVGYNRGGVLVDLGDLRGFVPASQLRAVPREGSDAERMQELARLLNTTVRVKVLEFDRTRNRLILSERVAQPPISRADQVLAEIQPQQTRKGVVRNITDFGAFVDLGGVEGLIHVSELAWQYVRHPRQMLTPGQEVNVYIIDVDREQKRIACSLKRLTPNPWTEIVAKLRPGDVIAGVITNVVSFGAFVRIADGVEGLIHISELAEGSFLHPRDVVRDGQTVQVRVMEVDPVRQRIGLSLRSVTSGANNASNLDRANGTSVPKRIRVLREEPPPPPPPDAGYWESLAQSGM